MLRFAPLPATPSVLLRTGRIRVMSPIILDGGVTWNYPVDLFDDLKYLAPGDEAFFSAIDYPTKRGETHVYNKQTLGLRVA